MLSKALKLIDAELSIRISEENTTMNAFKTHTFANGVISTNSLAAKEGFINYYDELNKLKEKREVRRLLACSLARQMAHQLLFVFRT